MMSDQHNVLVTFSPPPEVLQTLGQELGGIATITVLPELENGQRTRALTAADAVLAWGPASELRGPDEAEQLASTRLIQLLSAGVNHVPFDWFPRGVPLASNAGAYSEPMAEHVLAMALALLKRLPQNHAALARGVFERSVLNRSLRGSVVGILGFGGIGQATARVFSALGARVFAVNRSGRTSERVEWIGTPKDIDRLLEESTIVVIALPLTQHTRGLIGARELSLMKPDAILVNVARGPLIDEGALFAHLQRAPAFSVGLDTWWQERSPFAPRYPFLGLPNVLGSPHASARTVGALSDAARSAAQNIKRALRGEPVRHRVDPAEYADASAP